jgi:pimeloyl-ACP methyl ester carboxylesterase
MRVLPASALWAACLAAFPISASSASASASGPAAEAAGPVSGKPGRAADAASPPAPATVHARIGPDGNACGITPPAGGAPRSGKAGLIVWLHGGMRSQNREKGLEAHRGWLPFLPPRRYYVASPSAYAGAEWTAPQGLAHIEALIDQMLKSYPIDSGDVNLVGVSDGCLGVIAYSLRGARPVRRRVLISSAPQLVVPPENLPGQARFAQGAWDFVQGGRDRLFPADQVLPYLERFRALYPNARVHAFPDGEHDFSWYAGHAPELLRSFFAESADSGKAGRPSRTRKTPPPGAENGAKMDPNPAQSR